MLIWIFSPLVVDSAEELAFSVVAGIYLKKEFYYRIDNNENLLEKFEHWTLSVKMCWQYIDILILKI